ncbi:MAG: response regulator [Gammaproteobacteria bacterium]|nr:MAG: response regulator [Gammaproteobacteria bacterium]
MEQQITIEEMQILLVEPSLAQRRIIIESLRDVGITNIEGVARGIDAIEIMEKYPPDLVISAMYFEDMTGNNLINAMKVDETLKDIPFMLISSETDEHFLDPMRQAGVVAILPKPFLFDDLKKAIYASLDFISPEQLHLDNYDVEDLKVLVVDDSLMARKHIIKVLNLMGIERIDQAKDGVEAVEHLTEKMFDLVVTDYNMPEMDGRALIKFIRTESTQPDIPILMVTSETNETRLSSIQQSGVSAICDKPFESVTVRGMIERIMSS